jgi:hypothetical protein
VLVAIAAPARPPLLTDAWAEAWADPTAVALEVGLAVPPPGLAVAVGLAVPPVIALAVAVALEKLPPLPLLSRLRSRSGSQKKSRLRWPRLQYRKKKVVCRLSQNSDCDCVR